MNEQAASRQQDDQPGPPSQGNGDVWSNAWAVEVAPEAASPLQEALNLGTGLEESHFAEDGGPWAAVTPPPGLPQGKMPALSFDLAPAAQQVVSVEAQNAGPSLEDLSETDWSEASREELVVHNQELLGWVVELERSLQECQADLKANLQQYRRQESLLEERTEQWVAAQETIERLTCEVEKHQKNYQRQAIRIETLQGQLDSSQERIVQMELDCAQAQRRCAEQSQQLLEAEGLCRDLKSRLSRQQRHTLQFKAALEKSLAVTGNEMGDALADLTPPASEVPGELFPRPQPVQPWSRQLDAAALSGAIATLDELSPEPAGSPQAAVSESLDAAPLGGTQVEPTFTPVPGGSSVPLPVYAEEAAPSEALGSEGDLRSQAAALPTTQQKKRTQSQKRTSLAAIDLPCFPRPRANSPL